MGLGMFFFSGGDAIAKLLTDSLHPIQIVWSRQLGLLSAVVVILVLRGRQVLVSRHMPLQITRGVLAVGSATLFIFAIAHVPLADAVAVSFVAPFLVTVMGALLLREVVGPRRWAAVCVGFVGMLIVIRPGLNVFHPAIFLVVIAATLFALRQILSRVVARGDRTVTTICYTAITSSLLLTLALPFVWETPDISLLPLLLGVALFAAIGEVLVIKSLELAQAVVLAPVHYSLLIWGTLYGMVIFGQFPDLWTWLGAAIIMATGLYVLQRERAAAQRKRP